jgi:Raf kinase inhibitor-like YbhB/YbcL family protein
MLDLVVKSPAFVNNKEIPKKYSCDGQEVNPPLEIENIPEGTKTMALIIEDPDASNGTFDHWVVWNIPPSGKIEEDSIPGTQGINGDGRQSYSGMCPPSGSHRYYFKVYALDLKLDLKPESTRKKDLEKVIFGHVLAKGEIVGIYQR